MVTACAYALIYNGYIMFKSYSNNLKNTYTALCIA